MRQYSRLAAVALIVLWCLLPVLSSGQEDHRVVDTATNYYYSTSPSFTGNRVVDGKGSVANGSGAIPVELEQEIQWAVATVDADNHFVFVVTCQNGKAYSISLKGDQWKATELVDYDPVSVEQPPLVKMVATNPVVVRLGEGADVSGLTHAVPDGNGCYLYIASNGDLVLWNETAQVPVDRLTAVNALPDGTIVSSDDVFALYGGSTDSYRHCVLGDCLEGTTLLLVRAAESRLQVEVAVELENGAVFEGHAPLFADQNRIVTTVARSGNGAHLQVYNLAGQVVSTGPTIGWGWRHQLFYNQFGPDDWLLVDVLAPHVRMTVEFFDMSTTEMIRRASRSRFTTHAIDSRNLGAAVSGDLNGDGIQEAVVLSESRKDLVGLQLDSSMPSQVEEVWRIPLESEITTNIAAVNSGGRLAVGIGTGSTFHVVAPSTASASADTDTTAAASSETSSARRLSLCGRMSASTAALLRLLLSGISFGV